MTWLGRRTGCTHLDELVSLGGSCAWAATSPGGLLGLRFCLVADFVEFLLLTLAFALLAAAAAAGRDGVLAFVLRSALCAALGLLRSGVLDHRLECLVVLQQHTTKKPTINKHQTWSS